MVLATALAITEYLPDVIGGNEDEGDAGNVEELVAEARDRGIQGEASRRIYATLARDRAIDEETAGRLAREFDSLEAIAALTRDELKMKYGLTDATAIAVRRATEDPGRE
ncbi:MAG: hypothetical protein ABEJ30_01090 [Halorientalis sp.]